MSRGWGRDPRETFVFDGIRLRNKSVKTNRAIRDIQAPSKNSIELYFKEKVLYMMEDDGLETPIGGSGGVGNLSFTFSFGKKGNTSNAYLLADGVPSNLSGTPVYIERGTIRKVLIVNSAIKTFDVTIQEHTGIGDYVNLTTVNVISARTKTIDVAIPITNGKQIAIKITSGSSKDPRVVLVGDGIL